MHRGWWQWTPVRRVRTQSVSDRLTTSDGVQCPRPPSGIRPSPWWPASDVHRSSLRDTAVLCCLLARPILSSLIRAEDRHRCYWTRHSVRRHEWPTEFDTTKEYNIKLKKIVKMTVVVCSKTWQDDIHLKNHMFISTNTSWSFCICSRFDRTVANAAASCDCLWIRHCSHLKTGINT